MKNFKTVMELIGLSILINENTDYCSFVDFSGHVDKVKIRVYRSKEQCVETSDRIYGADLHYDPIKTPWKTEEEILSGLNEAKRVLSGYLYTLEGLKSSIQQKSIRTETDCLNTA